MKRIFPIVLLSGGSMLFTFGAIALFISKAIERDFDSLEFFQIALTSAG